VTDEEVKSTLHIAKLVPARLGVYRINARNSVGASEEKVVVGRRDRSDSKRASSSTSDNGRHSHNAGNGHTGKLYSH